MSIIKPIKVGIIGTGAMRYVYLLAYLKFPNKIQLTAVCDILEDSA